MHIYIYIYTHTHMHTYIHTHTHTHIYIYICILLYPKNKTFNKRAADTSSASQTGDNNNWKPWSSGFKIWTHQQIGNWLHRGATGVTCCSSSFRIWTLTQTAGYTEEPQVLPAVATVSGSEHSASRRRMPRWWWPRRRMHATASLAARWKQSRSRSPHPA